MDGFAVRGCIRSYLHFFANTTLIWRTIATALKRVSQ